MYCSTTANVNIRFLLSHFSRHLKDKHDKREKERETEKKETQKDRQTGVRCYHKRCQL